MSPANPVGFIIHVDGRAQEGLGLPLGHQGALVWKTLEAAVAFLYGAEDAHLS